MRRAPKIRRVLASNMLSDRRDGHTITTKELFLIRLKCVLKDGQPYWYGEPIGWV